MKKMIMLSIFIVIMVGMIWCGWGFVWLGQYQLVFIVGINGWEENRLIVYVFGGVKGVSYINLYEVFIINYNRGYCLFEVDFVQMIDGEFVVRYDWLDRLQLDLIVYCG